MNFKAIYIVHIYTTLFFIVSPIGIYFFISENKYYLLLAFLIFLSNVMLFIGYKLPLTLPRLRLSKIVINPAFFYNSVLITFFAFVLYSFYSAGGIPLFQIFFAAGDADLLRGELFKGRSGAEIILLYLSAIFTYVFVPLAVLVSFHYKFQSRRLFLALALLFCIFTLQKALLLNIIFPLIVYFLFTGYLTSRSVLKLVVGLFGYFVLMIIITGHGDSGVRLEAVDLKSFFSSSFSPNGGLEYFIWRVFAVPIYTAVDTLDVFFNVMGGVNTLGGTSNLFSMIFGVPKVELEKVVFEYQFGGYNPLANANATFAVSLFIDFWYPGLIFISFLLGIVFRVLERSKDIVIVCFGYLLALKVLNAPLIGLFFSAGFLYVVFHSLFLKFRP